MSGRVSSHCFVALIEELIAIVFTELVIITKIMVLGSVLKVMKLWSKCLAMIVVSENCGCFTTR